MRGGSPRHQGVGQIFRSGSGCCLKQIIMSSIKPELFLSLKNLCGLLRAWGTAGHFTVGPHIFYLWPSFQEGGWIVHQMRLDPGLCTVCWNLGSTKPCLDPAPKGYKAGLTALTMWGVLRCRGAVTLTLCLSGSRAAQAHGRCSADAELTA